MLPTLKYTRTLHDHVKAQATGARTVYEALNDDPAPDDATLDAWAMGRYMQRRAYEAYARLADAVEALWDVALAPPPIHDDGV